MFHSYFQRKNGKILTFNIVYFPNFEISAALRSFKMPLALVRGNTVHVINA